MELGGFDGPVEAPTPPRPSKPQSETEFFGDALSSPGKGSGGGGGGDGGSRFRRFFDKPDGAQEQAPAPATGDPTSADKAHLAKLFGLRGAAPAPKPAAPVVTVPDKPAAVATPGEVRGRPPRANTDEAYYQKHFGETTPLKQLWGRPTPPAAKEVAPAPAATKLAPARSAKTETAPAAVGEHQQLAGLLNKAGIAVPAGTPAAAGDMSAVLAGLKKAPPKKTFGGFMPTAVLRKKAAKGRDGGGGTPPADDVATGRANLQNLFGT